MALFKVSRGSFLNLPDTMTDGWAYFCTDTAEFFIDYADADGVLHRKQINAQDAKTLTGITLEEMISDWEQTDEAAPNFIKNKPVEMTPDDAMTILGEVGALEFTTDENGAVLTDENGAILVI